jgi:hypothetical protein
VFAVKDPVVVARIRNIVLALLPPTIYCKADEGISISTLPLLEAGELKLAMASAFDDGVRSQNQNVNYLKMQHCNHFFEDYSNQQMDLN